MCLLDAAGVGVRPLPRRRRARPVRGGRRPVHPAALRAARRRPGHRADRPGLQAAGAERRRALAAHAAAAGARRCVLALLGAGQPDLTTAADARRSSASASPVPRLAGRGPRHPPPTAAAAGAARAVRRRHAVRRGDAHRRPRRSARSRSNIPLRPEWRAVGAGPATPATGHAMVDFGDDALTRGRPHPMIDPTLRLERLAAEAADPTLRRRAAGRRARPRRAPRPGRRAGPGDRRRALRRGGGRELAVVVSLMRHRAATRRACDRQAEALARGRCARSTCPTPAAGRAHARRRPRPEVRDERPRRPADGLLELLTGEPASSPPAPSCSPTRCATQARRRRRRSTGGPPVAGTAGGAGTVLADPRRADGQRRPRCARMLAAGAELVDVGPPPRRSG